MRLAPLDRGCEHPGEAPMADIVCSQAKLLAQNLEIKRSHMSKQDQYNEAGWVGGTSTQEGS